MERHEATTLLLEMVRLNLVNPTMVSLTENKQGKFSLVIKSDLDFEALKQFIAQRDLTVKQNVKENMCIISKPDVPDRSPSP